MTRRLASRLNGILPIAYDSAGNFNASNINVMVNNTDDNPILKASIPTITIVEDNDSTTLNLSLYFKTLDGDNLKYNFTKPNSVAVHVNNDTQIANFSPAKDFSGCAARHSDGGAAILRRFASAALPAQASILHG